MFRLRTRFVLGQFSGTRKGTGEFLGHFLDGLHFALGAVEFDGVPLVAAQLLLKVASIDMASWVVDLTMLISFAEGYTTTGVSRISSFFSCASQDGSLSSACIILS
jgi:hypothetical protein